MFEVRGFWVPGFAVFQGSGFSGSLFRYLGFRVWVGDSGFRGLGFLVRGLGFAEFRVSGLGVSNSGFRVRCFVVRGF